MLKRATVSFVSFAFVALAGCSSGTHQGFTPLGTSSYSLTNAAVTVKVLHGFAGRPSDGSGHISDLVKAGNALYGTTSEGGQSNKGTVFTISPNGTGYQVLYSFKGKEDGIGSAIALTNVGGTLYGVTILGGKAGNGTVYSIDPAGTFKTLYSFKGGSDGAQPWAPMTNVRGTLYGTTTIGGANGKGTFFKISTGGTEKVLYSFGSKAEDGSKPFSPLIKLGPKFYSTTAFGGVGNVGGNGTIYSVTLGGKEAVLYRFKDEGDGDCTFGCRLTSVGGVLYGTAKLGGRSRLGSVFSVTTAGVFKTLFSSSSSSSKKSAIGGYPIGGLTNVGGLLYGTMSQNRDSQGTNGTLFSITTSGKLNVVYTFAGGNDAANPESTLLAIGNTLYGTSNHGGGSADAGTIYSVTGL
jgi:uncharacterized repeat protein (TIGR03803 family)